MRHPIAGLTIVAMGDADGFNARARNDEARAQDSDESYVASYGPRHADGRVLEPVEVAARPELIRRVVLKTDLANDAAAGFRSAVARSYAEHFYVDFDGVVFQSLDLALAGRRHADDDPTAVAHNDVEIIVVLNNRMPNLRREPGEAAYQSTFSRYQEQLRHPRPRAGPMQINGAMFESYGYTDAQYAALAKLLVGLAKVFPHLALGPPRDPSGAIPDAKIIGWQQRDGVLADWHTLTQRWAPGPGLDWARIGL